MREFLKILENAGQDPRPVTSPETIAEIIAEIEAVISEIDPDEKQPFWIEHALRSALDGLKGVRDYVK